MLNGRIAVVTGASAGIGLALARRLVVSGARTVINARRADRLEALAKELGRDNCVPVAGDAADERTVEAMLDAARSSFGRDADLVVINAGRGLNGSVLTSDTSQWEEMIRTNLLAAAYLLRSAARRMQAMVPAEQVTQRGDWLKRPRDIIVIGSCVGRNVSPYSSMYGSTKFAVHGLVEGARRELASKGVRVSLVEPGFVTSEFQGVAGYDPKWYEGVLDRLGPVLEPDDVAATIEWMAAHPAHVQVSDILIRPTRQEYP